MREVLKPLLVVAAVLAVPIVPFALFGAEMEAWIETQLRSTLPPAAVAAAVIGLLATDVFLPIPSSVVSTVAGRALGVWGATAASWIGMTAGAVLGFALGRWFGRPLAVRLSEEEELKRIERLSRRYGPLVLVLARPVPALAEASVLLAGTARLGWTPFLAAVGWSNLGIAAAFALLGETVPLSYALAVSVAIPLAAAAVARWLWPAARTEEETHC
jgi:uncharacterized membrane protein YdjX (TVP38/TMEM64 family)